MTYRPSDLSSKDCYLEPESRLNQQIRCEATVEGCPVIEESGTVCGETNTLSIFQEFRQIYDNCIKKLERSHGGNLTLKKFDPFRKLIEDLWEQNTMLVETVEELEQEATCRVTNLQDRLNKSCQKITEYKEDVISLIEIIRRFSENGILDFSGLKFYTLCPSFIYENFHKSCSIADCCKEPEKTRLMSSSGNGSFASFSDTVNKSNQEKSFDSLSCGNCSTSFDNNIDKQLKYKMKLQNFENLEQKNFCHECNVSELHNSDEFCCNENCSRCLNCVKDYNSDKVNDETCKHNKYHCTEHIFINLNIKTNSMLTTKSCCHCDCFSTINSCDIIDENDA